MCSDQQKVRQTETLSGNWGRALYLSRTLANGKTWGRDRWHCGRRPSVLGEFKVVKAWHGWSIEPVPARFSPLNIWLEWHFTMPVPLSFRASGPVLGVRGLICYFGLNPHLKKKKKKRHSRGNIIQYKKSFFQTFFEHRFCLTTQYVYTHRQRKHKFPKIIILPCSFHSDIFWSFLFHFLKCWSGPIKLHLQSVKRLWLTVWKPLV